MTTMNFQYAITELVRQINAASPKDKELAVQGLRGAIADTDSTTLRPVSPPDEDEMFDNMPV
ncbi:MAG: hypothetical protein ABIV25_11040 [Paracoccaceae bacterium]